MHSFENKQTHLESCDPIADRPSQGRHFRRL